MSYSPRETALRRAARLALNYLDARADWLLQRNGNLDNDRVGVVADALRRALGGRP